MKLRFDRIHVNTKHPFKIARETQRGRDAAIVELEWQGLTGLGEASPAPYYGESAEGALAVLAQLGDALEGEPQALRERIDAGDLRARLDDHASVRAALDMALWDLAGKRDDKPLYAMLGLDATKTPATSYSIGIDTPEMVEKKLDEADAFRILKMKMGVPGDMALLDRLLAREGKTVRIDANEGWDVETALDMSLQLHEKGVEFIEQPIHHDNEEDLRTLKRLSPLPVILDESVVVDGDVEQKKDQGHGINVKLMKCGGVTPALKLIDSARKCDLKIMLGCMLETSLGITAAAHLSPLVDFADLDGNLLLADDPFVGVTVRNSKLVLPDGPGLGVTRAG